MCSTIWTVFAPTALFFCFVLSENEANAFPLHRTAPHNSPRWPRLAEGGSSPFALYAEPLTSSAGATTPQTKKVREMASFLAMQLLEKILTEAGREESKLTEEDILNLAGTLSTISETKQAQGEVPTTWQAAEEAVQDHLLQEEEPTPEVEEESLAAATFETASRGIDAEGLQPSISTPLTPEEDTTPVPAATTIPEVINQEAFQRSLLQTRIQNDATSHAKEVASKSASLITPPPTIEVNEEVSPSVDLVVEDALQTSTINIPLSSSPRFPELISKEFGKPLEIAQSNVPALRAAAVPKREGPFSSDSATNYDCKLLESPTTTTTTNTDTPPSFSKEVSIEETAISESPAPAPAPAPAESAQQATTIVEEAVTTPSNGESSSTEEEADPALTAVATEELQIVDEDTTPPSPTLEDPELTNGSEGMAAAPQKKPVLPIEETRSAGDDLAQKYGAMTLEDRAFAILSDLGMVQTTKFPISDDDVVVSPTLGPAVEITGSLPEAAKETDDVAVKNEDSDEKEREIIDVQEPSKTQKDGPFKPIRSFLSRSRKIPFWSSSSAAEDATEVPNLFMEARQQPKSPKEEGQLAKKYGDIPDLGDRAYAILKDLGMI